MKETILYQTDLIEIGLFTVRPEEPEFKAIGHVNSPIMVFPKNSIWIQYEGADSFVADSTLVNLYNQGQYYHRQVIDPQGDYCHWISISDELLSVLSPNKQFCFSVQNMSCPLPVFIQHLVILNQLSQQPANRECDLEEQVLDVFYQLFAQQQRASPLLLKSRRMVQVVEQVKGSILSDLSQNMTLQQLSKIHGTTPFHLSRSFKRITGLGISHYRTQQRLRAISTDLRQSRSDLAESLTEMALAYGFSSHAHMTASFKRAFGVTPSQWSAQH